MPTARLLAQSDFGVLVTSSELGEETLGSKLGMSHAHDDGAAYSRLHMPPCMLLLCARPCPLLRLTSKPLLFPRNS